LSRFKGKSGLMVLLLQQVAMGRTALLVKLVETA
jgi:hypothetical protein